MERFMTLLLADERQIELIGIENREDLFSVQFRVEAYQKDGKKNFHIFDVKIPRISARTNHLLLKIFLPN